MILYRIVGSGLTLSVPEASDMLFLIAGIILFFGVHLVSACTRCRENLAGRLGENGYRGVFVAGSVAGFLLITTGAAYVEFVSLMVPWFTCTLIYLACPPFINDKSFAIKAI
ncbi:uncharacterized protein METZ01_LOCUS117426 [marine metagenome]|uniref:NnrU domain-containing protein n=1 Tax=marine metagenome TaxID=408172 RepID=A0A381XJ89_9ZZZZ